MDCIPEEIINQKVIKSRVLVKGILDISKEAGPKKSSYSVKFILDRLYFCVNKKFAS